jgi:hypothetical protein
MGETRGAVGLNPLVGEGDPVVDHCVLQIVTLAKRIDAAALMFSQKPSVLRGRVFSYGSGWNELERPVPENPTLTSSKKLELAQPAAPGVGPVPGRECVDPVAEREDGGEGTERSG